VTWIEGLKEAGAILKVASARSDGSNGVIPLGPPGLSARLRMLLGIKDLKRLIAKFNPDVIVGYRITSYGFMGATSGFHPFVAAAQNEQIIFMRKKNWLIEKILTFFARRAVRHADMLHAWSPNIAEGLKKFGAEESRILVMHRGINTDIFTKSADRLYKAKSPRLVSTRSLYSEYRLDDVIKALAVVKEKYPDAVLTVIGTGPEKKRLEALARSLELEKNIKFTGKLNLQELALLLSESDIYISLIRTEGLSSSLLEACSCGVLPVVADIPASSTVIKNGINGILLPETSSREVGEAVCLAFENTELRQYCAEYNPEMIRQKFDRGKNIRFFMEKYKELAKKTE
jgi:glycosyltransferase involved in cell wall biosynthesis